MQPARRVALDWAMRKLETISSYYFMNAVTRPRERQLPIRGCPEYEQGVCGLGHEVTEPEARG